MKNDNKAKAADYMDLPYTKILRRDDEGDVVGRIRELPGCTAHGSTDAEALENLRDMQALWIQDCIDSGQAVPCPEPEALLSGKWVQRVPRSLHGRLANLAKREGVSLNQLVTSILSQSLASRDLMSAVTVGAMHDWDQYFAPMAPWIHHIVKGKTTGLREIVSGVQGIIGNVHQENAKNEIEDYYFSPR